MQVTLTPSEMLTGALTGIMRQVSALRNKRKNKHGADGTEAPWQWHIEGALGECAAARALGIYWNHSVGVFKGADLGDHLQVRTRSQDWHELIVRQDDNPDHTYILVTGRAPEYQVHGWLYGHEAHYDDWWKTLGGRPGAWFVPQEHLHLLETLETQCFGQ